VFRNVGFNTQTLGKYQEDNSSLLQHRESLKSRIKCIVVCFSAIMNCLVVPLQAKLEDWRQAVVKLDKEHAKGKV